MLARPERPPRRNQRDGNWQFSPFGSGAQCVCRDTARHDAGPLHVDARGDECFYVVDGELSVCCGDDA
jgi:hypothetical protein